MDNASGPIVGMAICGVLLGAVCGVAWQVVAKTMRHVCLSPNGMCGLDGFAWHAAIVAGAIVAVSLIMWVLSSALRQSRVAVVTTAAVLIVVSAWFFALSEDLGWLRILIPVAVLGGGFAVLAALTGRNRPNLTE